MSSPLVEVLSPWLREMIRDRSVDLFVGLVKWFGLIAAVVIGTSLGNGVSMARSASTAFRAGVQQGLTQCPCNKQVSRLALTPTPLRPEPAAEPLKRVPVPSADDKQSGGATATPATIDLRFEDVSRIPEGG